MTALLKDEMQNSLTRIEAVFVPGRLGDRREEMLNLQASGDTLLFSGGLTWSVTLVEFDKRLSGESESLDAAFGDMAAALSLWEREHGAEAEVQCAVEISPEQGGQ
jgi:hypothetical protein